jgi:hypothetical protein
VASDLPVLAGGAAAATAGAAALIGVAVRRRSAGPFLASGHALTRSPDTDPLPGVLRRGLGGMTVAVRPGPHGELFIGPGLPQPGRTLRRLVLTPLFTRAWARGGRLSRDQRSPFRLAVEFAGPYQEPATLLRAFRMLDRQLRDHLELLSGCVDGRMQAGAVTVTVTGIVDVRELLAEQRRRYAFVEATFDDVGSASTPVTLAPLVSEAWGRRFGWDGREAIPAEERHLLHGLVREAHAEGRTVRMSGLPAGPARIRRAVWSELAAARVDVIADTDHAGLVKFLRQLPAPRPAVVVRAEPRTRRPPSPRPVKIATNQAVEVNGR